LRIGEIHPSAKLTEADVRAIRSSTETRASLGRMYHVSAPTISAIRMRRTWKHVV
jgi:hypothetical protein